MLHVHNLTKRFKDETILNKINFEIIEPKILALVGPNGSGKTTLLNCITNLTSIDNGTITIFGKPHHDPKIFKQISYFQDNRILYEQLTGYDHLKFLCDVQQIDYSAIIRTAKIVKMESYLKKKVRNYSLGMKQHLLLAMAIINRPKLLILDEPLNGMDPSSAIDVRSILLDLYQTGTAIIISSHNLDAINRIAHNIYFLKNGELIEEQIEDYNEQYFSIYVNDEYEAHQILAEKGIKFRFDQNLKRFEISSREYHLQFIINIFNQYGHEIIDIEKNRVGLENRYQQLFEEK